MFADWINEQFASVITCAGEVVCRDEKIWLHDGPLWLDSCCAAEEASWNLDVDTMHLVGQRHSVSLGLQGTHGTRCHGSAHAHLVCCSALG
jgi:hypothetical protein